MFGKIFERNNGLGRDFYTVLEDEPKAKSEESIRQKLKSLKDERNTHNQRIKVIDGEIAKLEEELTSVKLQNQIDRKHKLEAESKELEERLREIREELSSIDPAIAVAT